MATLIPNSEIDAAADDVRESVDQLIELGFPRKPTHALFADGSSRRSGTS